MIVATAGVCSFARGIRNRSRIWQTIGPRRRPRTPGEAVAVRRLASRRHPRARLLLRGTGLHGRAATLRSRRDPPQSAGAAGREPTWKQGPLPRRGADASIHDHLGQRPSIKLNIRSELALLDVGADAVVCLLLVLTRMSLTAFVGPVVVHVIYSMGCVPA
jgi:hypothetical protein